MRLENKTAIVVGGGQSGGSTAAIGNGRATAMLFAREGAKVLVVDRDIGTAQETADSITEEGNIARATAARRLPVLRVAALLVGGRRARLRLREFQGLRAVLVGHLRAALFL